MVQRRVLSLFDRRLRSDFRAPLRIGKPCRKGFQGRSRQSLLMLLCGLTRTAKEKAGLRTRHFQIFLLGERNYSGKRDSTYESESRECLKEMSLYYRLKNGCSHHPLSCLPFAIPGSHHLLLVPVDKFAFVGFSTHRLIFLTRV